MAYHLIRLFARIFSALVARQEYSGQENIPNGQPYILVTNHLSAFDLPVLLAALPPHKIRAFAAGKHRHNLFFGTLLEMGGSIWVQRGEADRQALREAMEVLKHGEALGVAPEGTRAQETHALQKGKPGAAYLATRADVPLVPVGITGTEKIAHNLLRLRRTHVRVVIGKPFRLPESGHVGLEKLHEYTDLIMRRIAELLPEEYRGVYGDKEPKSEAPNPPTLVSRPRNPARSAHG